MKELKVRGILVKLDESYSDNTIDKLNVELGSTIDEFVKMLGDIHFVSIVHIEISQKNINDKLIINGSFNYCTRILRLQYCEGGDISKFRQTFIHELSHSKFNNELIIKNNALGQLHKFGCDPAIYLIDEYMACKYANVYHNNLDELKHINNCQDNFKFYYKDRKVEIGALKSLATLIVMIIISDEILKNNNVKTKGIYNKDIIEIKNILVGIDFIPTLEEYTYMRELLKSKGYKAYNVKKES